MCSFDWQDKLKQELIGCKMPSAWNGKDVFEITIWGSDAGFTPGDIHCDRVYQMAFYPDQSGHIADMVMQVVGELISPCSGYRPETLDEFDYPKIKKWCVNQL